MLPRSRSGSSRYSITAESTPVHAKPLYDRLRQSPSRLPANNQHKQLHRILHRVSELPSVHYVTVRIATIHKCKT